MRLQRDSYAPKSCAFDAANVQFLRAHLCKSHPVLQQLTITHPYRLTCRYSFAKSSMAEAGVESLTFQDGLCAAWRPVSASCTD